MNDEEDQELREKEIQQHFARHHIWLKREWLHEVLRYLSSSWKFRGDPKQLADLVCQQWLFADIANSTQPISRLQSMVNAGRLDGPCVFQVQSIRDTGMPMTPSIAAAAAGTRHIQPGGYSRFNLKLSDGAVELEAIETERVPQLSAATKPGSKILIHGPTEFRYGYLLLNRANCQPLGGAVEHLVQISQVNKAICELLNDANNNPKSRKSPPEMMTRKSESEGKIKTAKSDGPERELQTGMHESEQQSETTTSTKPGPEQKMETKSGVGQKQQSMPPKFGLGAGIEQKQRQPENQAKSGPELEQQQINAAIPGPGQKITKSGLGIERQLPQTQEQQPMPPKSGAGIKQQQTETTTVTKPGFEQRIGTKPLGPELSQRKQQRVAPKFGPGTGQQKQPIPSKFGLIRPEQRQQQQSEAANPGPEQQSEITTETPTKREHRYEQPSQQQKTPDDDAALFGRRVANFLRRLAPKQARRACIAFEQRMLEFE